MQNVLNVLVTKLDCNYTKTFVQTSNTVVFVYPFHESAISVYKNAATLDINFPFFSEITETIRNSSLYLHLE